MVRKLGRKGTAVTDRRDSYRVFVIFSVLFFLVSMIVFLPFLLYRKSLVWNIDGYLQWYPVLVKMKSVLVDLFTGHGFSFWSWDTGLGTDFIGSYAIVLFDPFNYLALFFSKQNMDIAYSLIIVLKIYAAGLTMLAYLRYHKKPRLVCMAGALGYAFCSWSLMGMRHDFFMTQLVLFPLLILGVDKVEDKKNPLLLIVSVFLSVITSLYFSYMSAIFVFLYIIMRYVLGEREKSLKKLMGKMVRYILYAVTGGVLLAAPVLVSALYLLMRTSTEAGVDISLLPTLKDLLRYLPGFAGTYDISSNSSNIGMNMLFVSMIPAMFMLWRRKKASIWMFFAGAVILLLPGIQSVINGFSYSSGRWCYIFSFFFTCAAAECLKPSILASKKFQSRLALWLFVLLAVSIGGQVLCKVISLSDLLIVIVNLMFGFCILAIAGNDRLTGRRKMKLLFGTAVVNIAVIPLLSFSPYVGSQIDIYMTRGKCFEIYEDNSLKAAKQIDDKEFYRVDSVDIPGNDGNNVPFAHTPANANLYWEVPSLYEYLSTMDSGWLKFNHQLGNNSGYFRRTCSYSNDNRSRIDFLLGKKYFLGNKEGAGIQTSPYAGYGYSDMAVKDGVSILKSKYDTSLGYVFDTVIKESDYLKYPAADREQVLMQSVQMADGDVSSLSDVKTADPSEIRTETHAVPVEVKGGNGAKVSDGGITITEENAGITLRLQEEPVNSELYLVFHNLKRKPMTPDELWKLRKKGIKKQRKKTGKITGETDALTKARFYSNYLSYHPYGSFAIDVTSGGITKRLLNAEGEFHGLRDIGDYMVHLGYRENGGGEIRCSFGSMGHYTFDSIEVLTVPQASFDPQAEALVQNRLKVEEYGHNRVKGSIDTQKGGILFLSILYHDGWQVYVDGKKSDRIYHANTAFMGVEVPAGSHRVELVYRPLWFRETILLFFIGVIAVILIEVIYYRKRRRK